MLSPALPSLPIVKVWFQNPPGSTESRHVTVTLDPAANPDRVTEYHQRPAVASGGRRSRPTRMRPGKDRQCGERDERQRSAG